MSLSGWSTPGDDGEGVGAEGDDLTQQERFNDDFNETDEQHGGEERETATRSCMLPAEKLPLYQAVTKRLFDLKPQEHEEARANTAQHAALLHSTRNHAQTRQTGSGMRASTAEHCLLLLFALEHARTLLSTADR